MYIYIYIYMYTMGPTSTIATGSPARSQASLPFGPLEASRHKTATRELP